MIAADVCQADVGAVIVIPLHRVIVGTLTDVQVRSRAGMVSLSFTEQDGTSWTVALADDAEVTFGRSHLRERALSERDSGLRSRLIEEITRLDALVVSRD